jgi:cysteinyl-tRNA synthetase
MGDALRGIQGVLATCRRAREKALASTERVRLYDTLSRGIRDFEPIEPGKVRLYTCGPTVYGYAHIGNLRTYVFEDVLRRTLESSGYDVTHVMNVTDVGHLESDADEGEDKMVIASRRERRSPWEIARYYETAFFEDCAALAIRPPHIVARATEHIDDMIDFVVELQKLGYAYEADANVYFDIAKYPPYPELAGLRLDKLQEGARVEVDHRKRNPLDFVLWFSQSKFPNQIMRWPSPWGVGFPGWHIECSAMASKYLGDRIDIHCGGIDHIPVHHTNERAQSEARFGHRWVNTWMHSEFLLMGEEKMAKSSGQVMRLQVLTDAGFDPVHFRYLCLGARYRSALRFSMEALQGARNAVEGLKDRVIAWKLAPGRGPGDAEAGEAYRQQFWEAMRNDLDTPVALSVLWGMAKDPSIGSSRKLELLLEFDRVLGLGVDEFRQRDLEPEAMEQIRRREEARSRGDWAEADRIREDLRRSRIEVRDTRDGSQWFIVHDDATAEDPAEPLGEKLERGRR